MDSDLPSLEDAFAEISELAMQRNGLDFFAKVLEKTKVDHDRYKRQGVTVPPAYGDLLYKTAMDNFEVLSKEIDDVIAEISFEKHDDGKFRNDHVDEALARAAKAQAHLRMLSSYLSNLADNANRDDISEHYRHFPVKKASEIAGVLLSNAWSAVFDAVPIPADIWSADIAQKNLDAFRDYCKQNSIQFKQKGIDELQARIDCYGDWLEDPVYDLCRYAKTSDDPDLLSKTKAKVDDAVAFYRSRTIRITGSQMGVIDDAFNTAIRRNYDILLKQCDDLISSLDVTSPDHDPSGGVLPAMAGIEQTIMHMTGYADTLDQLGIKTIDGEDTNTYAGNAQIYTALTLLKNARNSDADMGKLYLGAYKDFTRHHGMMLNPKEYKKLMRRCHDDS